MEQIQNKRDYLLQQLAEEKEARCAARVNRHTTAEMDRALQSTTETVVECTRQAEGFFASISGAGSTTELQIQGQALMVRARQKKAEDKAAAVAAAKKVRDTEKLAAKELRDSEKLAAKELRD